MLERCPLFVVNEISLAIATFLVVSSLEGIESQLTTISTKCLLFSMITSACFLLLSLKRNNVWDSLEGGVRDGEGPRNVTSWRSKWFFHSLHHQLWLAIWGRRTTRVYIAGSLIKSGGFFVIKLGDCFGFDSGSHRNTIDKWMWKK